MPLDESELIRQIKVRQAELEEIRDPFEKNIWDEVSDYAFTRRADEDAGTKRGTLVYDGTPAAALRLWVDGIQGYHISRALEWFSYRIGGVQFKYLNDIREVQIWFTVMPSKVWQDHTLLKPFNTMRSN